MTEREIFLAALDLPDPEARAEFLDKTCGGDPKRRDRVEALLRSHDAAGSFLGSPAVNPPGRDELATQEVGDRDDDTNEAGGGHEFLAEPRRPDSLGRIGHYEVLEVLGRGGFGIVFRAFDEALQRVVAVKVLSPQMAATSPPRKRFLREARSSARVRHENVVHIYQVEDHPLPYLVMEFVPGETLQQRLDRTGPLEVAEVLRVGRQIAEGLAAAHAQGLIHRDIKPANILIESGPHRHVKLTDFGLARAADDASMTQSGVVAGTPMYMAPEQAQGGALDHRADLFSLGSVLYTMASGRPPFRASNTLAVLKRVAEDTPRPIREIIPEVPGWLCDIISRLHAKNPADRFSSAQEVADLLGRGQAATQRSGDPPPPVAKLPPLRETPVVTPATRPRSRNVRWGLIAAVLLVLVGGLGFTEASGVTNMRGTVIRLFSPEGTLVVEVDDPDVSVKLDGGELVITGAGVKEIRLKPGNYTVEASKDGKVVSRELVNVARDGRQIVKVTLVPPAPPPGPGGDPKVPPSLWTVLKPSEMKSEGGATLTPQDDGSILAGGEPPNKDVYTLTFRGLPAKIQALRLEVLPHASLPQQGPGRKANGKFVLTTVKAQLERPANPGVPTPLKLSGAWADNSTGDDSLVGLAIDAGDNTGWVSEVGKPHFAVFEIAEPIAADGAVLRVTLEFKHEDGHEALGCFRLSASADAKAVKAADWDRFVGGLLPDEQVEEVRTELKKRNPGFAGRMEHALENDRVHTLTLEGPGLRDVTPLRALRGFQKMNFNCGELADISPLRGLELSNLALYNSSVSDLSPLRGMKLQLLTLAGSSQVADLSPLRAMPLEELTIYATRVKDLTPLKDMKLKYLNCDSSEVTDLSPLKGMPLTVLNLNKCKVADLSALKDLPLTELYIEGSAVTDLSPIKDLPLKILHCDFKTPLDAQVVWSMKTLETINGKPVAKFWKEFIE